MTPIIRYKHSLATIYHSMDLSTDTIYVTALLPHNIKTTPLCNFDNNAVLRTNEGKKIGSFQIKGNNWWYISEDKTINIECENTAGGDSLINSEKTIVLHYLNQEGSWLRQLTQP